MQDAHRNPSELGQGVEHLSGHEVKSPRTRIEADFALEPHHSSGKRAAAMSTRSSLKGTPSRSSSRRCRAPFASDPSALTIRYHGTEGSWHVCSAAPARRGAPGETSP